MVVCAATAMLMLDIAVVNTALSRIAEDLDAGLGGLQWVVDAYTLALAATVLTFGSLADRFGRRRLFTIGLALFTLASAACAAADRDRRRSTPPAPSRASAPRSCSPSRSRSSPTPSRARRSAPVRWPPTARRSAASFAIGPLVGGALTSGLDWQWIFLVNIPLGIACIWITRVHVRESRDPQRPRASTARARSRWRAGLFLLVLALLRGNEEGWGEHADRGRARRRRGPARRVRRDRASRRRSRCCRSGCSATRTSPARRSRRPRSRPRSSRSSCTSRCTCSRCSG